MLLFDVTTAIRPQGKFLLAFGVDTLLLLLALFGDLVGDDLAQFNKLWEPVRIWVLHKIMFVVDIHIEEAADCVIKRKMLGARIECIMNGQVIDWDRSCESPPR